MRSDGDDIDDADVDDGVPNFAGVNLFVVQEVTVCNRPFCSISERGVRCNDVDLDATIKMRSKQIIGNVFGGIGLVIDRA